MYCKQHSSSGSNAKGVVVFAKRGTEIVDGSVYNSEEGFFTMAVYNINGSKIILVGVYGPPDNLDRKSFEIFSEIFEKIEMYKQVYGTQMLIIGGDFNVHLDKESSSKPRTVKLIKDYMVKWSLSDLGEEEKRFTWSRPGRVRKKSRIDYILISEHLENNSFSHTWMGLDHAGLRARLSFNDKQTTRNIKLKDWVLTTDTFMTKGRQLILETLLDHEMDENKRTFIIDRYRQDKNMKPKDIENEMTIIDKNEGVTHAHILMVLINRISALQRRVQTEMTKQRGQKLTKLKQDLDRLMTDRHTVMAGSDQELTILADIERTIQDIKSDSEMTDEAGRIRVRNFEQDQTGKNNAYTFSIVKEKKTKRQINKIIDNEIEYNQTNDIMTRLSQRYEKIVGQGFQTEMELEEFIDKYDITLDKAQDSD
jgi:hypothetical protein